MNPVRAKKLGFCMGVRRAVEIARDALGRSRGSNSPIYTLGPLIHNPQTLSMLEEQGVQILDENLILPQSYTEENKAFKPITPCSSKLSEGQRLSYGQRYSVVKKKETASTAPPDLNGASVIIRAHGVSPDIEKKIIDRGGRIIDATCPRVKANQNAAQISVEQDCRVFLAGEQDHAEIRGIYGYALSAGACRKALKKNFSQRHRVHREYKEKKEKKRKKKSLQDYALYGNGSPPFSFLRALCVSVRDLFLQSIVPPCRRAAVCVNSNISPCVIVGNPAEAMKAAKELQQREPNAKTVLIGQTTLQEEEFKAIARAIQTVFPNLTVKDSLCAATRDRQNALRELCAQVDAVIVVGGKDSANTRRLVCIAESLGKKAYLVESADSLPPELMPGNPAFNPAIRSLGISAGASTPDSVVEEIERALNEPYTYSSLPLTNNRLYGNLVIQGKK